MIIGIGTDICENERIRNLYDKFGNSFLERIYTKEELSYCMKKKDPIPHLAARFALKEAFIKSLNLNNTQSLSYKQIYLSGHQGKKKINISKKLEEIRIKIEANEIWFSISHAKNYSTATVILEKI